MQQKVIVALTAAVVLILAPALVIAGPQVAPVTQGTGPELLTNPGFEGPMWFKSQCCGDDGLPINEVQVAEGWKAWWVQIPSSAIEKPVNCEGSKDYGCYWMRPEFVDSARTMDAKRIHSGNNSQKYFSFGRMHEAGMYQQVTGIISGTQLHFSVYMMAWMCVDTGQCKGGAVSDQPTTMHLRVGIDPRGGTNPFSPDIVWSREVDTFDRWTQFSIDAIAQSDKATVFTHSRPEWGWARLNNDVYMDDASLTAVGTPQPTPTGQSGQTSVPAQAQPQPQPQVASFVVRTQQGLRPDGSQVHTVQSGDTLFGIALAYGVTVDDVVQLNRISAGTLLQIGQELIVKGPTNPPTPTAAAKPTTAPQPGNTPQPTAVAAAPAAQAAAAAPGGLCVQAFNDRDGKGTYDSSKELVANIKFTVLAGADQAATYTTTGADEPHCFQGLAPRAYTVRVESPKGYIATTDEQIGVALAAGQTANISFGTQPPGGKSNQAGAAPAGSGNALARAGSIALGVGGLIVLIGAGVVGFLFISRRR
jgi:LysM repeat protein